jgi:hypothetical protein
VTCINFLIVQGNLCLPPRQENPGGVPKKKTMPGLRTKRSRAMSLMEVSLSLVLFTLFMAGGLRLYIETMSRQLVAMRAQEAKNLSYSIHEEEFPNLFTYSLGSRDLAPRDFEGRIYYPKMTLEPVAGYNPDELRLAKYEVRYTVDNVDKITTRKVVLDHRE